MPDNVGIGYIRKYWGSAVLVVVAFTLVYSTFRQGVDAGMASGKIDPSWRFRDFGIPIVLGQMYYRHPYDYVGYKRLETYFEPEGAVIDDLIPKLKSLPNVNDSGPFLIVADDKGIVDFVRLAFEVYGLRTSSLYYLYFTIFAVSCLLFVVSYFGDTHKLGMMVLVCVAFYATMPAFIKFPPGISVLDLHAFSILSLVAALHILVSALDQRHSALTIATSVGQALILILNYHIRSSSISQTIGIACAYPVLLYLTNRHAVDEHDQRPRWKRAFAVRRFQPLIILLVAVALVPVWKRITYDPAYFSRRAMVGRPFYHNLLIGMGFNPFLQQRYNLGLGDLGAADAVDRFLQVRGRHPEDKHWATSHLNSTTTMVPFEWVEYEEAARDLYFTIWKEQPRESLRTLTYYHPVDGYEILRFYLGYTSPPQFGKEAAYRPLRPDALIILWVTAVICGLSGRGMSPANVIIALALFASSLIAPMLVYFGGFIIMAEVFVAGAFGLYVVTAVGLSWVTAGLVRRLRGPAVAVTA